MEYILKKHCSVCYKSYIILNLELESGMIVDTYICQNCHKASLAEISIYQWNILVKTINLQDEKQRTLESQVTRLIEEVNELRSTVKKLQSENKSRSPVKVEPPEAVTEKADVIIEGW